MIGASRGPIHQMRLERLQADGLFHCEAAFSGSLFLGVFLSSGNIVYSMAVRPRGSNRKQAKDMDAGNLPVAYQCGVGGGAQIKLPNRNETRKRCFSFPSSICLSLPLNAIWLIPGAAPDPCMFY